MTLIPKDLSPDSILQSKATGEPPYMLASSLYFAVKDCIREAHKDAQAAASRGPVHRRLTTKKNNESHSHDHHAADSGCAKRDAPATGCDEVAGGGSGSGSGSGSGKGGPQQPQPAQPKPGQPQPKQQPAAVAGGGPPYEDVALPVPATLDHRVVALGVEPAEFVLQ